MPYRIMADKRNWIVEKQVKAKKKDGTTEIVWRDQGIYPNTLETLAEKLLQMRTREEVQKGKDIFAAIEAAKKDVLEALSSLGLNKAFEEVKDAARNV